MMEPRYSQFLLMTRYSFLAASIVALIAFFHRLRKVDRKNRIFEQKYLLALSVALFFFNDPIFAVTLLSQSFIPALFSTIFVVTFYCLILLFWLVQLERVSKENERKGTKLMRAWKIVLIAVIWLTLILSYITMTFAYQDDPGIDLETEYTNTYEIFKIFSLLLVLIVLGIFISYYMQACRTWQNMIWRNRIVFTFSTYFIFCAFLCNF
eukprot:TRINITY_DN4091_c0_g1_i12.p1 TRINITY_DN4091_c0_g1~~TRINITY_DN4091_c0_g1_i12.p1  ORF type:complete len:209 (+),score=27.71 TRINITY_DN4091_c0_g1_i12:652-1278(+)